MAEAAAAAATGPLADRAGLAHPAVALTVLAAAARFSLRCRADDAAARGGLANIGLVLPQTAHAVTIFDAGGRVMWLGPNEWAVVAPAHLREVLAGWLAEAVAGTTAAVVDVSDAVVALRLEGPAAVDVLAAGCPLDLHVSAFAVGRCARSRLAKVDVVLYRRAEASFEVEVGRSVARYAYDWLVAAAREFTGSGGA